MKREAQDLIRDLLDGEANRAATLLAGGRILRRRRHWRTVRRGFAVVAVIAVAAAIVVVRREHVQPTVPKVAQATPKTTPVSQVRALTDEELLSLFPGTPVGLASTADGKKRLIFPRPGDEARYIRRL